MTLHLYLARRFARAFLGVLGAFSAALVLVDLAEQARRLEGTGGGFREALGLALLNAPRTVHEVLPLVAVIATIALFLGLSRSSEMVAIRAAGRGGLAALRGAGRRSAPVGRGLGRGARPDRRGDRAALRGAPGSLPRRGLGAVAVGAAGSGCARATRWARP